LCQKFPFVIVGRAISQPRLGVAAEQVSGIPLDRSGNRAGDRADGGNRGHTEDETADKDAEAAHASAQLAPGEPERVERRGRAQRACPTAATRPRVTRRSSTILPSISRTWRSHRSAMAGSWVTSSRVAPCRACCSNK